MQAGSLDGSVIVSDAHSERGGSQKILVLEVSTTSAKALLYDISTGGLDARTEEYRHQAVDVTRHDADTVMKTVFRLGREVAEGKCVAAIALVSAWHGVFLTDSEFRPISLVYLWSNTEPAELCLKKRSITGFTDWFYRKTGCMVNATFPVFTLGMLSEQGMLPADVRILDEACYMNWLLTGEFVQTRCQASGSGMMNISTTEWDSEVLEMAGVSLSQLPRLVDSSRILKLSTKGAQLLGLQAGIPVLPANSDGGSNQVGVGALIPGQMTFSVGTSGALRLSADHPVLNEKPSTWCYLSPKSFLSGVATAGACNCIDWFRKTIAQGQSYAELEGVRSSATSNTPVFLPFLFGERCPGWDDLRRGGLTGVSSTHTVSNLYQAVQEGILFNLYQCYQDLVELNGSPELIKLSGGILQSSKWTQMCADIFGQPMEVSDMPHASMMGGVVLAREILQLQAPAKSVLTEVRVVEPEAESTDAYREKYERYLVHYRALGAQGSNGKIRV